VNSEKYIGLDVQAGNDLSGRVGLHRQSSHGMHPGDESGDHSRVLRGDYAETLSVTLEEGNWATWLYDLLKPHVDELVVCNPRKNALLKDGKQERPHRCAQSWRSYCVATSSNRSTTARRACDVARAGAELSDHGQKMCRE